MYDIIFDRYLDLIYDEIMELCKKYDGTEYEVGVVVSNVGSQFLIKRSGSFDLTYNKTNRNSFLFGRKIIFDYHNFIDNKNDSEKKIITPVVICNLRTFPTDVDPGTYLCMPDSEGRSKHLYQVDNASVGVEAGGISRIIYINQISNSIGDYPLYNNVSHEVISEAYSIMTLSGCIVYDAPETFEDTRAICEYLQSITVV